MINVIIYEDNKDIILTYKTILKRFFFSKKEEIRLYTFDKYRPKMEERLKSINGDKIYLFDIEVSGKSGLDLARSIRLNGDWFTPIIIITNYEHLKTTAFTSKLLMLDFISKREKLKIRIPEALSIAYDIINTNNSFSFQYNGELFCVSYKDILYFKKDLNDNYTTLVTSFNSYKVKECINAVSAFLSDDNRFVKTHRSCIVNTSNITKVDFDEETIFFPNHKVNYLTKSKVSELKSHLAREQIIYK